MKSKLNSNVTGIVKITIFFTVTIKDRFKIIIRNKKIWANLAEVYLYQFGDSNESASLKMKEQSFNKIPGLFWEKITFLCKAVLNFWSRWSSPCDKEPGATQDKKNQKIPDDGFL